MKWTIGTVNYKSEIYMPWKLKMFHEFEDIEDFEYIIIDTTTNPDKKFFNELTQIYPKVRVIYLDATPFIPIHSYSTLFWGKQDSGHHAAGLNTVLEEARKNNSDYIMIYDPDFFWVQRNMLKYFEAGFENEGYSAMGAPYHFPIKIGDRQFPSAFGSAYKVKDLENLDFTSGFFQEIYDGKDVGWKIRKALSNKKFQSFSYSDVPIEERIKKDEETFKMWAGLQKYEFQNKRVAYHLIRGSQGSWHQTAEAYCQKFYNELAQSEGLHVK